MKKLWLIALALVLSAMLCFCLASCGEVTVDQLMSEFGALLEGGGFAEGSIFNFDQIELTEEKADKVFDLLDEFGISIDDQAKTYIYDIFVTKNNVEVQPDGKVKITIPAPEDEEAEGYNVYHVKDNGAVESIPATLEDGQVSFETDGFSTYVLTPTYNCVVFRRVGDLVVGCNMPDGVMIHSSYAPLVNDGPSIFKGTYRVGEETTLDLQVNHPNYTFLGWYEAEEYYLGNFEKPVLKDTPVSTEKSYTFRSDETEYAIYAVFAEKGGRLHFETSGGGAITLGGEELPRGYSEDFAVGKSYELAAVANEGYRFVGWQILGEMSYSTVEEESFTFVTKADERTVIAVFRPVVTSLTVNLGDVIYDVSLLEKYESIGIAEFNAICNALGEGKQGKTDYVITGKIKSISNTTWGNMILVDGEGNELHIYGLYLEDGTRYSSMASKPAVGDVITVHGLPARYNYLPEMKKAYLLSATPVLPDFESVTVRANTPEGSTILKADEFTVDTSALNAAKPGEYSVTYTYKADPEIQATVTVKVLAAEPVEFSAYINTDGTLLLDGVEIGLDYYEVFKDGFGKVTLTAVGAENTVFKGWYTAEDHPVLISSDATFTFEFDKDTYVYAEFDYLPTDLVLDGMNAGFDTRGGVTVIRLPAERTYNVDQILVYAIVNGEPVWLEPGTYTVDLGGFNGANPAKGSYVLTFDYEGMTVKHAVRVVDPADLVYFSATAQAGGRVESDKTGDEYTKGEQVTVTVELRSESDYEFLGWYTVDASGAVGTTCLSTERTYTVTLNENTHLIARIEPKITRLEVEGYEGEPTRVHVSKFWLADREIRVYACGALGKRVELTENDYTVDFGGLDLTAPAVGKYTVTYTYKVDPSITYSVTVLVWNEDHSFFATQDSPDNGWLLFEGELTHEAGGQYVNGEEITVTAAAKEGYTFLGWYLAIDRATHIEYKLISTDEIYTFVIEEDTRLQAKFGAPVTSLELIGTAVNQSGEYILNAFEGERIDLSRIGVWAYSLIEARGLSEREYAVDLGGLVPANPEAGVYTVTYTYKEDGEETDVTMALTVNVMKRSYQMSASGEGGEFYGNIEYNGNADRYVFDDLEEGTRVVLKAVEVDVRRQAFLRWEAYDYESNAWELYSAERSIAFTVDGDIKLRAVFGPVIQALRFHERTDLYEKGVEHWNFDGSYGIWNEELGKYVGNGDLTLYTDSEYVDGLEGLFANFHIVAYDSSGRPRAMEASDLLIDLGDYRAEEGWYEITAEYGKYIMNISVFVVNR